MLNKVLKFLKKNIIPGWLFKKLQSPYHFCLALSGAVFYGFPSRDIFVLGVTGTKGKSTTLALINKILEENEKKTLLLSSAHLKVIGEELDRPTSNTMLGRWQIQRFLRKAVNAGCHYALVEVTSEGVDKHRHRFIDWNAAVFLNLHPEHIESHGSFEAYREAKLNFFRYLSKSSKEPRFFFVNGDDENSDYFDSVAEEIENSRVTKFYRGDAAELVNYLKKRNGGDWVHAEFNRENIAAAVAFARSRGINMKKTKEALAKFDGVEGRVDFLKKKPFGVVVDFAHTPDSLEAFYKTLKEDFEYENIIGVFGSAGGGRDKWKRPKLGEVADKYCRDVVLTSEDPYNEKPEDIIEDIFSGFPSETRDKIQESRIYKIPNRREAIRKAIELAKPGDVAAITGMGSQDYMYTSEGRIDWSDKEIVEEALNN